MKNNNMREIRGANGSLIRSLADGTKWIDSTERMLVRESWKKLFAIVLAKSHIILQGKAGRGKSLFALFVIFEILHCARNGKTSSDLLPFGNSVEFPADPSIVYVDRNGIKHLATLHDVTVYDGPGRPLGTHYYIADNVDIGDAHVGSLLTMAVTSGDVNVLKEFSKRINGVRRHEKDIVYMPPLDITEMKIVFQDLNADEIQFKFDVLGGNPRLIDVMYEEAMPSMRSQFYGVLEHAVDWMFGSEYVPSSAEIQSEKQKMGQWAVNILSKALDLAIQDVNTSSPKTDTSLFKEFTINEKYRSQGEQYATFFLGFVAGTIVKRLEASVIAQVSKLFGSSGVGNAFEFVSHAMLAESNEMHWCLKSDGGFYELPLGKRRKVLIRNVEDIASLREGDYGLPTISNFPLVDAILPPAFSLQMTTSKRHEVSNTNLTGILDALQINASDFSLVFVVPEDILSVFKFPENLGTVTMYVTIPQTVTKKALSQLCRKRKANA